MLIGTPLYYLGCLLGSIRDFAFPEEAERRYMREKRRVEEAHKTIDEMMFHATGPQPMQDYFH